MAEVKKSVEKKPSEKVKVPTPLQQAVIAGIQDAVGHLDPDLKRQSVVLKVVKADELAMGKDQHVVLVYLNFRGHRLLQNTTVHRKIVSELEKRLRKTVLLLCARIIQSRWIKRSRKQKRPFSRTLTSVYSAMLDELVLPSTIIGARTRFRLDGSAFHKITLDRADEQSLEDRVDAIQFAYKKLTSREIQIDFQKNHTFHQLKTADRNQKHAK